MIIGDYTGAFLALLFATLGAVIAGYVVALCVHVARRVKPAKGVQAVPTEDKLKAA